MEKNGPMLENVFFSETYSIGNLSYPAKKLEEIFNQSRGARIGESTVVSQKIHTYDPAHPEEIRILQDIDAGQVFYHRHEPRQVYHLDVFHERGLVDHRKIGKTLKEAIARYNATYAIENCLMFNRSYEDVKADLIDIQTGTGGGRITGNLNYGKKLSLRRAHENHVHIAASLPVEHLACLFIIVSAVEAVILSCQLEIRKNEKIVHQQGGGQGNSDMSAYSDHSDSFLRDKSSMPGTSRSVQKYQYNQDAVELMNDFDHVEDMVDILKGAQDHENKSAMLRELEQKANGEQTLNRLSAMGILKSVRNKIQLTDYGKELLNYLKVNIPEIEAHFRQVLRLIKPVSKLRGKLKQPFNSYHALGKRSERWTSDELEWIGEVDTSATVVSAAQRTVTEKYDMFFIAPEDLRQKLKRKRKKVEICLILDASASMAGQRIKAAKFLVRHLLLSTPDRISVVIFQEQHAQVQVPLTRDFKQVENRLKEIRAYGSTPLAIGIQTCLQHIRDFSARNPLVVLITDGVATYSSNTRDPIMEAIDAAKEIKASGYDFTCIGLKPHKNYLSQLAEAAGGSLYVVDELEKQVLVKAVWSEYAERC
jgi:magnesium chelatase subunit D